MAFLKAAWKDLLMVNYVVDPAILAPFVPVGTSLDLYKGRCYVSLVGFMFIKTRVLGIPVPFHTDFEEVNLRFYVGRWVDGQWRRGVVFIKEIVPKPAVAFVARTLYKEPYTTMPMRHSIQVSEQQRMVEYQWKSRSGRWNTCSVRTSNTLHAMPEGSEAEFITEHYYGYTRWNEQRTMEYEVRHPRWQVYVPINVQVDVDFEEIYGPTFAFLASHNIESVLLAEGSEIQVLGKQAIHVPK
jgi:uncharacterized protein YqjF (DUF2071 family)